MVNEKPVTAMSIKIIAKITSHEEQRLCGVLDSIYFKEPYTFTDVMGMVDIMETTFDAVGFPNKALLPRTFGKAKERMRRSEMDLEKMLESRRTGQSDSAAGDALATFEIYVSFRLNAEWQGRLHCIDNDVSREFTSIIELSKLLDELTGSVAG